MKPLLKTLTPVLVLTAVIWGVEVINFLLGHQLAAFGILPRSANGLIGILLAPFIHAGLWHTVSNTVPLIILGGLTLAADNKRFWVITGAIILISGILVWLFARNSYHVGASGLVFGYFGALLARAVIERSAKSIVFAVVTLTLYGGLLWGILPLNRYISFESHLFGLLAGVLYIWMAHKLSRSRIL